MKGMKGKVLKKMKSIKTIGFGYPLYQLTQDRMLQAIAASDANTNSFAHHAFSINTNINSDSTKSRCSRQPTTEKEAPPAVTAIDAGVSHLLSDEEDEEEGDKENNNDAVGLKPRNTNNEARWEENTNVLSEITFRRPDPNSRTLFDPNLLVAFQLAIVENESKNNAAVHYAKKARIDDPVVVIDDQGKEEEEEEEEFDHSPERKCPPGGADSVILYTTSLRGIRKTFEDCRRIRFLLESFRVPFAERDVSMHAAFREELQRTVGSATVVLPPRLFIRGRHIGGADRVLRLHERGRLRPLLQGIPTHQFRREPCERCRGVRFVLCFRCNGGRKVMSGGVRRECVECNENGLLVCSACC